MIKPENHPREAERLAALRELKILDSLPDKDYDDITFLASEICGVPIALVSLIDEKRQWIKSKKGIEVSETSRDISFCGHAILQEDIFVVEDSSKDERFFDNPFFLSPPHVQFYAGMPILDPVSKLPIGTLCVIDHRPRKLSSSQQSALKSLAAQVNRLLELRIRVDYLANVNESLVFQKTAFDNMSEGVVIHDYTGRIIDFNPSALRLLDMDTDQIIGKTSLDSDWCAVKEDGSNFPGDEHPAMMALKSNQAIYNTIMGIKRNKDQTRWLSINAVPIFLSGKREASHCVATFIDVTQQKITLQALIQSVKMNSLGEMAAGIAHEVNNPLAIMSTLIHKVNRYLKQEKPDIEKAQKIIEKLDNTVERISKIIKGLKFFSRNSENDPWQIVSLNSVIQDTLDLCLEKFKKSDFDLQVHCSDDFKVNLVSVQLSQVILNLLNNAYDAIADQQVKWVRISTHVKSDCVLIRIMDSGNGIPDKIVNKMMQPFFTTKPIGSGTGLGLSISKGIIESFHGRLFYENVDGHTCFTIELPIHSN